MMHDGLASSCIVNHTFICDHSSVSPHQHPPLELPRKWRKMMGSLVYANSGFGGVEVNFAGGRLNKKLELAIGIGETVFKHPLGEEEQVRWEGRRLCSKELKLTLDVQHPRLISFRKPTQLAHFEVLLSTVDKSIVTLSGERPLQRKLFGVER
ncbi:hypothetical protein BDN72DRAFT_157397 [Pluteus cervinus]|uniref:Uncharacterized protein n=1 Tax=Pluteus cervinus TaxID=181527 RepID=A0ACD3AL37_9AGAR|nr:hypothetical protein BDN72DRAFT_157397 [Pluteus cervinus]